RQWRGRAVVYGIGQRTGRALPAGDDADAAHLAAGGRILQGGLCPALHWHEENTDQCNYKAAPHLSFHTLPPFSPPRLTTLGVPASRERAAKGSVSLL